MKDPSTTRPGRLRRWLFWIFFAAFLGLFGYHAWIFAQIWNLRDRNPETTAFMEQGLERLRAKSPQAKIQQRWMPYEKISVHLKRAIVAAEDQKFIEHEGFDVGAMQEAYDVNAQRGRIKRGGSTISQQLAKNLFLTAQRSYLRKAEEAVITEMVELALSKRRILEIYLNVIEWGNGIYGAEAAARHYYGVSAAELTDEQAAHLAAMVPNPRFYDRNRSTPYLEQRSEHLLRQMAWMPVP